MSVAIDIFEHVFEHEEMPAASVALAEPLAARSVGNSTGANSSGANSTVLELQARIKAMQSTTLDSRLIPTHPAFAGLLPGGGLKEGAVYSVEPSAALVMALLAGPSAAGTWCAVVGMPEFGAEAARRFGIDLERLVLIPHPGDQWLTVTAALTDVLGVVVTRPPAPQKNRNLATDSSVSRLGARLRERGSTLLVLGAWPQSEAMLSLSESTWTGVGQGNGHLSARQATVTVSSRSGRPRSARLWLPDADGGISVDRRGAGQQHETGQQRETGQQHQRWGATG
ncbi:hypothetical protein BH09ACT1_BH09ACT1_04380 [soil metagenome]